MQIPDLVEKFGPETPSMRSRRARFRYRSKMLFSEYCMYPFPFWKIGGPSLDKTVARVIPRRIPAALRLTWIVPAFTTAAADVGSASAKREARSEARKRTGL